MLRTELKKIVKDSILLLLIVIAIPVAMGITEKDMYLAPALELFLILYASFTGWALFDRERQDGAMEYVLSLPLSRIKLFALKFFPRLAAVLLVLLAYSFIHEAYAIHFLLPYFNFAFLYITIFFVSLTLSLSMKSFLGTFFITVFLSAGLYSFIKWLDYAIGERRPAVQTFLTLLVVPLFFVVMFRRYDLRPLSYFNKRYVPGLIAIILAVFGFTYLTTRVHWGHYHLTAEGHLLAEYSGKTVFKPRDGTKTVFKQRLMSLHQQDGTMVVGMGRGGIKGLARLDLDSREITSKWPVPDGYWVHGLLDTRAILGDHVYIWLTGFNHRRYIIMDIHGTEARTIPVNVDFGDESTCRISGVTDNPLQFIVLTESSMPPFKKSRVFRIFADGSGESLGRAEAISTWQNRLLIFRKSEMVLYELGEKVEPIFRLEGDVRLLRRKWANDILQKVAISVDKEYRLFDMETATMKKLPIKSRPYYYFVHKDGNLRLIFLNKDEITVSEFVDGRIRIEKVWYTSLEGFKIFRVFESGVTVYSRDKHEIFLYDTVDEGEGGGG